MNTDLFRLAVQTVVSLGLLGAGLYILLTFNWKENPEIVSAATGWVGLTIGYWLR